MTTEPDHTTASIRELARFYIGDASLSETLTRLSTLAKDALGADMAGLTLLVAGRPRTAVFTSDEAPEIDAHQYESGEGPCLEAYETQQVIRIVSISADGRYPDFAASASRHGIVSTLSLPLAGHGGERLGALNIYFRNDPTVLDLEAVGLDYAEQVSAVLANARVYNVAIEASEQLRRGLESRSGIEHAVGILMAAGGRTPEEAFQLLVRASQRENRKLRDIASELVKTTQTRRPTDM